MNRCMIRLWMLACWGLVQAAAAQIEVSWTLAHNRTVLMEPIRAQLRIANFSGRDLDLTPNGNATLFFNVEDQPGSTVPASGNGLVRRALIIPNNETREFEVDLLDDYRIVKGQSYMLTPRLRYGGMHFSGQRLALEVQPGLELLKRDFGMMTLGDGRSVSLRLLHRNRADRLFFRIDDSSRNLCLGVYELGRVIRFFVPRVEMDRDQRFHVLHQSGPERFVHSVFDFDGLPSGRMVYAAPVGSIRFDRDEHGQVQVAGATPYEEDPDHPGRLIAPAQTQPNPHDIRIGELPSKGRTGPPPNPRRQRRW